MNVEQENAIQNVVEQFGMKFTLIGIAVWISTIIYAIVLLALHIGSPSPSSPSESMADFLPLLTAIMGVLSLGHPPLALFILKKMRQVKIGGQIGISHPSQPEMQAEQKQMLMSETGVYFRASLVAAAVAESPGIYALVICLLASFDGGLGNAPMVLGAAVFMAMLALGGKALVIPTAGRLEDHLRAALENAESNGEIASA